MMKQPAENTNATPREERAAAERAAPPAPAPDYEEIATVARELWNQRSGDGGSPEEDWYRAERIVRDRRAARLGNPLDADESYSWGTGAFRTEPPQLKEHKNMEKTTTGTMEQSGSGLLERGRERAGSYMDQARNMMEEQPQSFPRAEHREGRVARSIEQQTARIPSDTWLWAAVGSMGLSLALELSGKERTANFVGHWVPTLLIFGLYNKIVKLQGSDGV